MLRMHRQFPLVGGQIPLPRGESFRVKNGRTLVHRPRDFSISAPHRRPLSRREREENPELTRLLDSVACSRQVMATAGTRTDIARAAGRSWNAARRTALATRPFDALRIPAVVLASAISWGAVAPARAVDGEPIVGSEILIGTLIPITGDPIETRSVELRIEFHRNSARITEQAGAQLRELGVALISDALRSSGLAVYGHTDTTGPADYNRLLSEHRAQAVAAFLREHFAIGGPRIREVRGYGEERPRVDLPPDAAAQRRVEIVVFHERPEEKAETSEAADTSVSGTREDGTILPSDSSAVADPDAGEPMSSVQVRPREGEAATTRSGYIVVE